MGLTATATDLISMLPDLRWLIGPIFGKELRVAGRQRRVYVLRFVYVSLLTAFMAGVWFFAVGSAGPGSLAYLSSRFGTAGRYIAIALIWFQFVAAQVAAPMLLGDAIRSEVRKRTLHILAVTPLSGMQIAIGKLAAGLLPIVVLLATSLPLLSLVRVFGGVSLRYLISGVAITFSALVFAGALHLLVSVGRRRIGPTLWFCLLGRFLDSLVAWLALSLPAVGVIGMSVLRLVNPTNVLLAQTREMLTARPGTGPSSWWLLHCLIVLAGSVVVLWLTARRIRTVAVESAPDRLPGSGMYKSIACPGDSKSGADGFRRRRVRTGGSIRRVKGSPVLWKELRIFAVQRSRRHCLAKYGVPTALIGMIVAAVAGVGIFGVGSNTAVIAGSMVFFALALHVGAAVGLSGAAARMISREREARTLPVLLTTPLKEGRIVRDKALAVLRQSLPALALFFLILLLSLAGVVVSTPNKFRLPLLIQGGGLCFGFYLAGLLGIGPLLAGLGLYCGALFKTAAGARGCTFAVVLLGVIVSGFGSIALVYSAIRSSSPAWLTLCLVALGIALGGAGAGLILLRAAARRLRRNVF